jgi:transcriptional regulator with XRE-family HTH domain
VSKDFKSKLGERVRELREMDDRSLEEVAEEAGIHRTMLGKIERGEREPSISNTLSISEALGATITEVINPESFRMPNDRYVIEESDILDDLPIDGSAILMGIEQVYENLDTIDLAFQRQELEPIAEQFDEFSALSTVIGEFFASGVAEASDEIYEVNAGDFPDLVSTGKKDDVPGIEVKVAMEDNQPKGHLPKTGAYISVRYVLAERDKSYERGERNDTPWIWEVRIGEMKEEQFNESDTEGDSGKTATFSADALWGFDCVYFDPNLLPYTSSYYKKKNKDVWRATNNQETL